MTDFLHYISDPRPIGRQTAVFEKLKVWPDLDTADIQATYESFMATLVALPGHQPIIVKLEFMPNATGAAFKVTMALRYRLIGVTPPPPL